MVAVGAMVVYFQSTPDFPSWDVAGSIAVSHS
jgi:hypothetical protein